MAETVSTKTKKKVSSKGKTYYYSFMPMIRISKAAYLLAKDYAKRRSISISKAASAMIERGHQCLSKSSESENSAEISDDTGKPTNSESGQQPNGSE